MQCTLRMSNNGQKKSEKKDRKTRLAVRRETLRTLTHDQLAVVAGGWFCGSTDAGWSC